MMDLATTSTTPASTTPAAATPTTPALPVPTEATPPAPPPAPNDFGARIKREQDKRRADLEQQEIAKAREAAALLDEVKRDPKALAKLFGKKDFGDVYSMLTEIQLNGGAMTPDVLDGKLAQLEQRLADQDKQREKDAAEREISQWRSDVAAEVKGGKFRLINLHGTHNQVTELIENTFTRDGRYLTVPEAAQQVEQALRKAVLDSLDDELLQEALKSRQPQAQQQPGGSTREVPQSRTIHSGLTSTTQPPSTPKTREQRLAAALHKLEEMQAASRTGG